MRKTYPTKAVLTGLLLAALAVFGAPSPIHAQQERVVAVVEGENITMRDVETAFQSLPREARSQGLGALYRDILERLIQQRVVFKRGREAKIQDLPELKRRLKVLENHLVHDMYLAREVEKELDDNAVRQAYDAWLAQNPPVEEVRARHALVETEAEAREIIQLVIAGRQFADLAKERSKGPSSVQGGDLGWFSRGRLAPEFEQAAFALSPNQFTANPIKTEFGWHVILVEDKRTVPPPTLEQLRPIIIEQMGARIAAGVAARLVSQTDVQRFDINGNPIAAPPVPAQ